MWPAEMVGFLYAMACTKEGRDALAKVDETGIPHGGLRALVAEARTGNGTGSLRDLVRLHLQDLGVKFDASKAVFDNVGQHVENLTDRQKRRGPLCSHAKSLVAELYDHTRGPTTVWSSDRIKHLVRCVTETMETLG
jgi:hypothetical protein